MCVYTFPYPMGVSTHLIDEEEYDFCTGEALLVPMETRETEVNSVRPVTTGAESSEKGLHPGLVQSQEAAWRKQLGAVPLCSFTYRAWSGAWCT